MCEKYNGWTNRETWLINLWNVFEGYQDDFNDVYEFSQFMKEQFEELCPPMVFESSVFSDLIGGAISNINWYELAEGLLEE